MASEQLFIKMALDSWNIYVKRATDLFNSLPDEQIMQETSPGRNRGIYLFGHLVAVHDRIIELFFLGQRLHPELDEAFLDNPDKSGFEMPSIETLRGYWAEVHGALANYIDAMQPADWFARHNAVTEADFEKEPHRNKLNLIINRTNHLATHYGQIIYLKKA